MIQGNPFTGMSRSAASAARIAMSTTGRTLGGVLAGALVSFAAHAGNCSAPPVSGAVYNIVNEGSGLFLDVMGGRKDNGTDIIQWQSTSGTNQHWKLTKVGNDAWTLQAMHSQKSLDLSNWRTDAGAPFKQWDTNSQNANQQFYLRSTGSGAVNVVSRYSWMFVTADAGNGKPGIYQDYDKSAANQRWFLNPVDGSCSTGAPGTFGSFMGFNRILIGGQLDEWDPNHPNDNWTDTINKAPWDVRYSYLHSPTAPSSACYSKCEVGCMNAPDGGWWGCWGMSSDGKWNTEPAIGIRTTNEKNASGYKLNGQPHRMIQQWTYYSGEDLGKMQRRLNKEQGRPDVGNDYKGAIQNWGLLKSYLDDYRFLLRKVGAEKNIIHLEPDLFGFLRSSMGDNPHAAYAPVRFAGGDDCKQEEESLSGLVSCMFKMTRQYATNSTVGLHFTCWNFKDPEKAKTCVTYYKDLGAGKGDFMVSDVTDRDAAYAEYVEGKGKSYWWNDQDFAAFLSVIKGVTEGVGKPMILWQIPLGNESQWNAKDHWKDQKVQILFDHMEDLAKVHVVALQFGAGWGEQTSTATDGGYLLKRAQEYYSKGGVRLK